MFDTEERQFLEGIPYPQTLTRKDLCGGDTWKLEANVQYLKDSVAQFEFEHEQAMRNAGIESNSETRANCITEIENKVMVILVTVESEKLASAITEYFAELT